VRECTIRFGLLKDEVHKQAEANRAFAHYRW